MFGNIKLNNILLLGVVGLLIFYFMNPSLVPNDGEVEVEETAPSTPEVVTAETVAVPQPAGEAPKLESSNGVEGLPLDHMGASLDTAFIGAVAPGTAVDEIDFNKNNVKEFDSKQYLPKEVNDEWFDTDFTAAKYELNDDKMVNTNRYIIGVNTVGQSLKNPSYDIRGTVPIAKYTVSPWNNSTYEPDTNIKPLY